MKVKYTIEMQRGEVPEEYKRTIRAGCLWDTEYGRNVFDSETVEVFDSEEEALAALKNYKPEVIRFDGYNVPYWYITEYYVQRSEFNEDDEYAIDVEYLEWTEMKFSVIEKSERKTLVTFENFGDALDYYDELCDEQDYDEDDDEKDDDDEDDDEKEYYIECNGDWVYGNI